MISFKDIYNLFAVPEHQRREDSLGKYSWKSFAINFMVGAVIGIILTGTICCILLILL